MIHACLWAEIQAIEAFHRPLLPPVAPANLSMVQGDLLQLAGNKEFDFIYYIDVLEHIQNNQQVARISRSTWSISVKSKI